MAIRKKKGRQRKVGFQPTAWHPRRVQYESPELYFIDRFLALGPVARKNGNGEYVGREIPRGQLENQLRDLQTAIIERRITQDSHYKNQVQLIQKKLIYLLQKHRGKIRVAITPQTHAILKEISNLEIVRPSVALLQKYVALHGQTFADVKEKIKPLRDAFRQGIRSGMIGWDDPFHDDIIKLIVPSLTQYLEAKKRWKVFSIVNIGLHGLVV